MHGSIDKWQSIILSLTRYIGAIHKTSELLKTESPQSSDWIGATTWLKLFFTKPLIIVGLALDPQELFLRWLLLQRASINEQNYQLPSFYLERESSSPLAGKNNFLKFVGVNVCKMGNVYDEAIWKNPV